MEKDLYSLHISHNVPIFLRVEEIFGRKEPYSFEEVVDVIKEISYYENKLMALQKRIIEATYNDLVQSLLEPLDYIFEEEYNKKV
jgi:hypothetical protein